MTNPSLKKIKFTQKASKVGTQSYNLVDSDGVAKEVFAFQKGGFFYSDDEQFIKLYDLGVFKGLRFNGLRVLCWIFNALKPNTSEFEMDIVACQKFYGLKNPHCVYRGLKELKEKKIILGNGQRGKYMIDVTVAYNGKRVHEYKKSLSKKSVD